MHSNLYNPRWLPVFTQKEQYSVIAFVVNQNHPLYVNNIPDDEAVDIICAASGIFGPCADYFTDTTMALNKMGLKDKNIENLTKLIKERKSE
jgi:cation transport protein ChaC